MAQDAILAKARPIAIIMSPDRKKALGFYHDVLGLEFVHDDGYGAIFKSGETTICLATVPGWTPHQHTVLGFAVDGIEAAIDALAAKGVNFHRYDGFTQDVRGIWTTPESGVRVAWFNDSDGNVLSLAQYPA